MKVGGIILILLGVFRTGFALVSLPDGVDTPAVLGLVTGPVLLGLGILLLVHSRAKRSN